MSFKLEDILKERNVEKTELANRMGVSRQTIYGYLKNPSLKILQKIAIALDMELFELFEMTGFTAIYSKDINGKEKIIGYLKE